MKDSKANNCLIGSTYVGGLFGKQVAINRQAWNTASRNRALDSAKLIDSVKYAKMTDTTGLVSTILSRWQETEISTRSTFIQSNCIRFSFGKDINVMGKKSMGTNLC